MKKLKLGRTLSGAQASLSLHVPETLHFLYPPLNEIDAREKPTQDTVVRGSLTLHLKKPTVVPVIKVKLYGTATLHPPDQPYDTGLTIEKRMEIKPSEAHEPLEKGDHTFVFSFIVPASTAPYERGAYGKIRHQIKASVKGLGLLGADLVQQIFVELAVLPGEVDQPPPGLDTRIEGFIDDLGPYSILLKTPTLTVAGLLLVAFSLPSPRQVKLESISARIEQTYKMYKLGDKEPRQLLLAPSPRSELLFHLLPNMDGSTALRLPRRPDSPPRSRFTAQRNTMRGTEPLGCMSDAEMIYKQQFGRQSRSQTRRPASRGNEALSQSPRSRSRPTSRGPSRSQSRANSPTRDHPEPSASEPTLPPRLDLVAKALEELAPACIPPHVGPDHPLRLRQLARIPNADWIRATTVYGTVTPLEVSHRLIIDIEYISPEGPRRVFTASKRLTIASCSCMMKTLSLPSYTAEPAEDMPDLEEAEHHRHVDCVCQMPLSALVHEQAEQLLEFADVPHTNGHDAAPLISRPKPSEPGRSDSANVQRPPLVTRASNPSSQRQRSSQSSPGPSPGFVAQTSALRI